MVERQLNRPPLRIGREDLAKRLPWLGQSVRPQMNAVFLRMELFATAAVLGIGALAIVDRNSLAGVVRAHEAAKA